MTLLNITIGISMAVIGLVVYSALVVSGKQEQLARRMKEENRFDRTPYSPYSTPYLAFETSEELMAEDAFEDELDLFDDDE